MIKDQVKKWLRLNTNEEERDRWIKAALSRVPAGARILDAGAGQLRYKPFCDHLAYVSQDFCQYEGVGNQLGLQTEAWDTSRIDLVCDITRIPELDKSFDAILCSEVLEHVPSPEAVLLEFSRLLKPGGQLILTAPFASLVHFAPFYYATGFSRYWYEHHLPKMGFEVLSLTPNGDWFDWFKQEIVRLPRVARRYRPRILPFAFIGMSIGVLLLALVRPSRGASELGCFGWHCLARKL